MRLTLLAITFLSFSLPSLSFSAEGLKPNDEKELTNLFEAFRDSKGGPSDYPKYFEEGSLAKYMLLHKRFIRGFAKLRSEDRVKEMFELSADLKTVLGYETPAKYFSAFKPAKSAVLPPSKLQTRKVVAIGGTQTKAYVIVAVDYNTKDADGEVFHAVWPAVKTKQGWRLLVTADWFQRMRHQVESVRVQSGDGD
jgi:hypothetical protein